MTSYEFPVLRQTIKNKHINYIITVVAIMKAMAAKPHPVRRSVKLHNMRASEKDLAG
jgi:hypothetical protein